MSPDHDQGSTHNWHRAVHQAVLHKPFVWNFSLDALSVSQCEADTTMLSCYVNLRSQGRTILLSSTLPMRTCTCRQLPSHEIPGILCIRKKNELLSCQSMCSDQNVAKCLIPFHVITAFDSNSCFYGHGKLSLFERMAKSAEVRSLLLKYRESLQCP